MGEVYRIGDWDFDVEGAALRGAEGERRLEDRAARTLALLCRRRGETVGQAEILQSVWNGRAVSPNSVAVVVGDLRRQLGDDAREPRHIVTIPKRGYRLNGGDKRRQTGPRRRWAMAAGAATLLLAAVTAGRFATREAPAMLVVEPVRNDTGETRYAPLATALDELVTNRVTRSGRMRIVRAGVGEIPGALRLQSHLILWNGQPTLSMSAVDGKNGSVVWAAMASGPADAIASHTIESLDGFAAFRSGKL